jgi:hypothetical protein
MLEPIQLCGEISGRKLKWGTKKPIALVIISRGSAMCEIAVALPGLEILLRAARHLERNLSGSTSRTKRDSLTPTFVKETVRCAGPLYLVTFGFLSGRSLR